MSNKRNSYLVSKAMKNFLLASILTMAVQQINTTVDGIIVSNLVNPDALSAISLYMPLSLAISSFGSLLGIGATIVAARYLGELNKEKADKTLSTAVASVLVFGVLLGVISLLVKDEIISIICQEERLVEQLDPYMTVMLGCSVVTMMGMLTDQMIDVDGHPEYVTKAVLLSSVGNILLDFLFVAFLGWGIAGSAWATILATLISMLYLWKHILSPRCSFTIKPFTLFSGSCMKINMQQGASLVISNLVLMLMFATMNNIIQTSQGSDGMFVFAICMNLLTLGMMFSSGVGSALMSIGGFLNGQQDYKGIGMLVNRGIVILEGAILSIVVVIQICPNLITSLFGADTPELQLYSNTVLRTFSWILPFVLLALLAANIYQMLGKLTLVPVTVLSFPLVLIPSMLLWVKFGGNDSVWYAFPQSGITILLLVFILSQIVRRKEKGLKPFTLVPVAVEYHKLDLSIPADADAMKDSLKGITDFLSSFDISRRLCNDVNLCVEELMLNIVQHSGVSALDRYFDVNIRFTGNEVIASLKDDGKPFDPVKFSAEKRGMGLKILHSLCQDIEYKYMYGQNMTFLKWNINN